MELVPDEENIRTLSELFTEDEWLMCFSLTVFFIYTPEDAEDHNSCGKRDEGNTVANSVANLHLPEKPSLLKKTNKKKKNISTSHCEKKKQIHKQCTFQSHFIRVARFV